MKKPHEQEWYVGDKEKWQVTDGHFVRLGNDKSGACMVLAGKSVAEFVAAAPDMARALLMVVEREDPCSDIHKAATSALRKAGVL